MSGTHCLPLHTEGKFSRDKLIHIIRGQEGAEQHEGFAKANTSECTMNLGNPNSAKVKPCHLQVLRGSPMAEVSCYDEDHCPHCLDFKFA